MEVPEREGPLREKEREKDTGLLQLHWILISSLGSVNELEKMTLDKFIPVVFQR